MNTRLARSRCSQRNEVSS